MRLVRWRIQFELQRKFRPGSDTVMFPPWTLVFDHLEIISKAPPRAELTGLCCFPAWLAECESEEQWRSCLTPEVTWRP